MVERNSIDQSQTFEVKGMDYNKDFSYVFLKYHTQKREIK